MFFVKLDLTNLGLNCLVIRNGPLFLSNRDLSPQQGVSHCSCRLSLAISVTQRHAFGGRDERDRLPELDYARPHKLMH